MRTWTWPLQRTVFCLILPATVALLAGGCPYDLLPDSTGGGTPSATSAGDGTTPDTGSAEGDGTESTGGASGPAQTGTLIVDTVTDATNTYFDIYTVPDGESWDTYQAAGTPIALPPGLYDLTQYFNSAFLYAEDVAITAGETTTVTLGAIQLVSVDGATDDYYDIYDSTGQTMYSAYNAPNVPITAPPGTFVLKEYFNGDFEFARDVVVVAGEVTTVEMGGIKLVTVAGASDGAYAIYSADGTTVYATYNEPNVITTAPAGTFTLKEYFNDAFTYASDVTVQAGEVTTVEMGAIRYNGTLAYDIYTGGALVSSYNEPGRIITAPPGTYALTEYFDDEHILATNVVVTAGAITDVP